ncbi:unnamed protein product [Blepharisma stoltei]|uniref:LAGLIDADG homing endonuclease n=1 Tax=Blepharisma stoltei TaxID=1481888 RepID=A0AAU9IE77_9CILI|nr:unnamed protein product [Blepharisma stoltei]
MEPIDDFNSANSLIDYFTFLRTPRKSGRRPSYDTWVLSLFNRGKKSLHPKKEYLRCQLIRGHKRINRNIMKLKFPKKTLNKLNELNDASVAAFDLLKKCFEKHREELSKISRTEEGPETDGKAKRYEIKQKSNRSFNHLFCKTYFEKFSVRESYHYYVSYLFSDFNLDSLCKKFGFRCCLMESEHTPYCYQKWGILHNYAAYEMLKEIEIQPFVDPQSIIMTRAGNCTEELAQIMGFMNFFKNDFPQEIKNQIDEFVNSNERNSSPEFASFANK